MIKLTLEEYSEVLKSVDDFDVFDIEWLYKIYSAEQEGLSKSEIDKIKQDYMLNQYYKLIGRLN